MTEIPPGYESDFGPPEDSLMVVSAPDNPMAVAREFLDERYRDGDLLLRYHRGSFHRYTGSC